MKQCSKCLKELPEDAFYRGHGQCKECCSLITRRYYVAHKAEIVAYKRHYHATHREEDIARSRRYRKAHYAETRVSIWRWNREHPEAVQAHTKFKYALRAGKLTKPLFCTLCLDGEHVLDAHHEDYSKALDVVWLCRVCHTRLHAVRN